MVARAGVVLAKLLRVLGVYGDERAAVCAGACQGVEPRGLPLGAGGGGVEAEEKEEEEGGRGGGAARGCRAGERGARESGSLC